MGFSSRKLARLVSLIASRVYFCIIFMQLPLFRFPCQIGTCETPIEVTSCQLISNEILPEGTAMILLYPAAIKTAMLQSTTIPNRDELLHSFKSNMVEASATTNLEHLEVLAGSYLCVAGAILGLMSWGRMSFFGLSLVLCGIAKETFVGKNATGHHNGDFRIYPVMLFVLVISFCSIRCDVRKLM